MQSCVKLFSVKHYIATDCPGQLTNVLEHELVEGGSENLPLGAGEGEGLLVAIIQGEVASLRVEDDLECVCVCVCVHSEFVNCKSY